MSIEYDIMICLIVLALIWVCQDQVRLAVKYGGWAILVGLILAVSAAGILLTLMLAAGVGIVYCAKKAHGYVQARLRDQGY